MSMTALVSAFARAYHSGRTGAKVYEDSYARALLSEEEYRQIGAHMAAGVSYFDPAFQGDEAAALRRVMEGFLSPAPLARAAFAAEEFPCGAAQVLALASGCDTVGYGSGLPVFEVDRPEVLRDKEARLCRAGISRETLRFAPADLSLPDWPAAVLAAGFDTAKVTFCAVLGLSYYLTATEMAALLRGVSFLLAPGSRVVLDVPLSGQRIQGALASAAGEPMRAVYCRPLLEDMAQRCGLGLRRWLSPEEIQARFFAPYNAETPEFPLYAPPDVAFCTLEKA